MSQRDMEQTRYFTQGYGNLVIITGHKPLVKIFGDRTLDEISNSRLFRLKQRTLPWRFQIHHLPGKTNHAADVTSRNPSQSSTEDKASLGSANSPDAAEIALMTTIRDTAHELGAISWTLLAQETAADACLGPLLHSIEQEAPLKQDDPTLSNFSPIYESIYQEEGVLMYQDRVVIPPSLGQRVLQSLHAAHQGVSTMEQRARSIVYWPGMTNDIRATRERCHECSRNAPSQARPPPLPTAPPSTPFEAVFADFFDYKGSHYLVVGDRLSGWVEVLSSPAQTNLAGSTGLIRHLRAFFATFGVPEELSSDGGPEFTAKATEDFLRIWDVRQRLSSVSFPQSNGRAEVAVKTAKRLLLSNTGPTGSLDQDRFLRAILQLRNTPDPDCNLSPAQIIFGRPLRDTFAFVNRLEKFSNPHILPLWRQAWAAKEDALRTRISRTTESLREHSRPFRPLAIGTRVFLQNQLGPNPNKWDRSGVVVETEGHDQYRVKVDGSGRLTLRNRRFLRAYTPATPTIPQSPVVQTQTEDQTDKSTWPQTPQHTQETVTTDDILDVPTDDLATVAPGSPPEQFDVEQKGPSTPEEPSPQPLPAAVERPRRTTRRPKHYEPETGTWIN